MLLSHALCTQADDIVKVPKDEMAEDAVEAHLAYQLIHDELMLEVCSVAAVVQVPQIGRVL